MTDEANWDTQEVDRWLSNDEDLYHDAIRATSARQLRDHFEADLPGCHVDWDEVDWDYIFDQFEEDRNATDP